MPVQFWLSDDDRPCVFCGHVSAKGVVTQVIQHRFFTCADCMGSIIPEFIEERVRHLIPFKGEPLHCVCCGKNSGTGIILELKRNWSFTCEKCAKEVIPAILGGWRGLNNIGKVRRRVEKKREILTHEKRKAAAEKIKDINHVQGQLVGIKMREERREATRNAKIQASQGAVLSRLDIEHMMCEICKVKIDVDNLTCPVCGQLYCQYCGAKMNMEAPGQCPRCGGVPNYTPPPLVVTTIDDIPPEDRFWENLPECPKCKAAVQPDWTECPFCGQKLKIRPPRAHDNKD